MSDDRLTVTDYSDVRAASREASTALARSEKAAERLLSGEPWTAAALHEALVAFQETCAALEAVGRHVADLPSSPVKN
ncbi:hypothetical protein [Polyangium mundeleinium]|uniref:Uncharacterized protein n=1 Tax=Polyangium mundeleinium TaxID=2995306 RepID=A0ABT5ENV9_9BACT|nr:hypothetical protein [Polyangium mundeleinium]MDC0742602.1 hypothetical protein [Polyangium mundeleinium]